MSDLTLLFALLAVAEALVIAALVGVAAPSYWSYRTRCRLYQLDLADRRTRDAARMFEREVGAALRNSPRPDILDLPKVEAFPDTPKK